ncbi:hypothetical protein [Actinomycetospora cinnamomea]|uniref:Uncharacterized protein n=1 Tax=Actinomycetospora cinnamomea TaxID=663609 RepID=A0A2U1FI15_9PSEU|nr:hypothetical protein [Actinomycetospora cinnamomea]PVZ11824.1 hypothetical protein C8D89_103154 [Actinomycetospora cinnamomea]
MSATGPPDTTARFCADFLAELQRRGVSFRRAEAVSGWGKSTIAAATRGPGLPNVDLVTDVLAGVGVEADDVAGWRSRHERLREAHAPPAEAAPPAPPPVPVAPAPAADPPPAPRRSTRRRVEIAAFAVLVALVVGLTTAVVVLADEDPAPTRTVVVQNRVAIGRGELIEDRTSSYLATRPVAYCASMPGCKIPGTDVWSGATFTAVCWLTGEAMTNADLTSTNIGQNPNVASSALWLGARAPDGRIGYISEVYLAPSYRGGLGLPPC